MKVIDIIVYRFKLWKYIHFKMKGVKDGHVYLSDFMNDTFASENVYTKMYDSIKDRCINKINVYVTPIKCEILDIYYDSGHLICPLNNNITIINDIGYNDDDLKCSESTMTNIENFINTTMGFDNFIAKIQSIYDEEDREGWYKKSNKHHVTDYISDKKFRREV